MLTNAIAYQINAVSEMVLNLLKKRLPIKPRTYDKLRRQENVLREVGRQKFVETSERTSTEADRERILERIRRLFQSMLCSVKRRDEYGYAVEGVDVVSERQQESK